MRAVDEVITRISKNKGMNHYKFLRLAVEMVFERLPEEPDIGDICEALGKTACKNRNAVYKALSREGRDLWQYEDRGDLERTLAYVLREAPRPKELVAELAQAVLRETQKRVEYHILEVSWPVSYGIWGRDLGAGDSSAAAAPFSRDRAQVERIVSWLNQEQVSLEMFRDLFQRDALRACGSEEEQ